MSLAALIAASTPGGIEAQEARGQREFVRSETLPRKFNRCSQADFEALGFVFGEPVDELFIACMFPEGWTKQPTDHSMWSELLDAQGRVRAMIFYKAAFYDRDAHISLKRRYTSGRMPEHGWSNRNGRWIGYVKDQDEIIWQTEVYEGKDYAEQDRLEKVARAWLDEHYPDHENNLAYW